MVIIKIKRKGLLLAIAVIMAGSVGYNVYSHVENSRLSNKYESLVCIASQFQGGSLIAFVTSDNALRNEVRSIEIFDVSKGEVIKNIQSSAAIQKTAEGYIKGITGMYPKVKAFPEKGFIVRIPMEPSAIKNPWLNDYGVNSVNEVFILFPEDEKPYLLILDSKYRPLFYTFEGNTDVLLKELDFGGQGSE